MGLRSLEARTDQMGIKYAPSVTPGRSARNRNPNGGPLGNRYNGTFYEAQLENMLKLNPVFIFGAMFDEYPESKSDFRQLHGFLDLEADDQARLTGKCNVDV